MGYVGASATLTVEQALLCSSNQSKNNFGTAWVMLHEGPPGQQNFLQVGYFEANGGGTRQFDAYENDAGGFIYQEYDGLPTLSPGQVFNYAVRQVLNDPGDCSGQYHLNDCLLAYINGVLFGWPSSFGWEALPSPYDPQFNGETFYPGSDIPGSYFPTLFANLGYMGTNGVFYALPASNLLPPTSLWHESPLSSGPSFSIWAGSHGLGSQELVVSTDAHTYSHQRWLFFVRWGPRQPWAARCAVSISDVLRFPQAHRILH
jgi:hypothetical protein